MPTSIKVDTIKQFVIAVCLLSLFQITAHAQLRIVSYNTLGKINNTTPGNDLEIILEAIGNTSRNGIAKRVDILSLQEQASYGGGNVSTENIATILNNFYGVTSYTSNVNLGDGVGFVYDSSTVDHIQTLEIETSSPRDTLRMQFRPAGYTSSDADVYLYSSHWKAGQTSNDEFTRNIQSIFLSNNADSLPQGTNHIFSGDFNFYSHTEPGYLAFTGAGNGQVFDPLGLPAWPNGALYPQHNTQSTRTSSLGDGGAGGGNDDRFDAQYISNELLDGEGISYIGPTSTGGSGLAHSYQAFGNDGVSFNQAINNTYNNRSQSATVLDALHDFSDHLPVIADYQVPAIMDASVFIPAPTTVNLNDLASVVIEVENIANVLAEAGADELDYTISTSGDLFGFNNAGSDLALGTGSFHQYNLVTNSLGMKSGTITITSTSHAVENSMIQIPVSFEVVQPFAPEDLNMDGFVDSIDLGLLLASWGQNVLPEDGELDGTPPVDSLDLGLLLGAWNPPPVAAAASIPEPSSIALFCISLALIKPRNRCRLS